MTTRPHCAQPDACRSKSAKHCLSCARRIDWANPEIRARKLADIYRLMQGPDATAARTAAKRRATARRYVKRAGLPLLRRTVDRARRLLDADEPRALVVEMLRDGAGAGRDV